MIKHTFKNIARLTKNLRTANNMSQLELSKMLGFKNGQFISNIERAKCSIPFYIIPIMAKSMRVDQSSIINAILEDTRGTLEATCMDNQPKAMSMFKNVEKADCVMIGTVPVPPTFKDYI